MAPTLLLTNDHAPSSSPYPKMPQVFVVPPEEDHTPAWCCFDANMPPSASTSASYADSPHHVLDMCRENVDVPLLYHDLKEPRSPLDTVPSDHENRSIMDVFMEDDYMEFDNEMGLDTEELEQDLDPEANVGNDSEVVEVVKVGRYTADVEEHFCTSTPPAPTSKSLKARAFEVFRILTNADKDPRRSRSKAQVILPPGTQIKKTKTKSSHSPTNSSPLSHPSMTPQASPSISSFDLTEFSSIPRLKGPRYPLSLRNVSFSSAQPSPAPLGPLTSSSTVSPNFRSPLSTSPTRPIPNRRHFSMTINRIFSSSKSDKVLDVFPISRSDLEPLAQSSSEPETPIEEVASLNPNYTLLPSQKSISTGDSAPEEGDGCEMRLGSLHFDSLSFDVNMF